MSIRTTQYLTREAAEAMALRLLSEKMASIRTMSNEDLGNMLDGITNDIFSNYLISEDGEPPKWW